MDQKRHKVDQKGLKNMKKGFLDQKYLFLRNFFKWQSSGKIRTVLQTFGKLALIWKNPDSFETIRKIGNYLEKSGQF